ncbi:MAG TPA: sigma-54 dependent transcriptional regulator [Vicinamibacterales bacterium]|jgi:two-component system NtrC family response regulator|nr:sigma-54 dependent transcriptional regulator [Vicinamibacterales bacterium]
MTKTTGSILLVDDEAKIRNALAQALREDGHEVVAIGSPREAQRLLARGTFDVLIVDNLMPELTGLDLIRELVSTTADADRPQILLMTAHATIESAIEAMKLGALDYLQKPFEIDELLVVVHRALDHQRLRTQHGYLLSERDEEFNQYGIVGRSRPIQDVIRTAQMVAKSKSTVLVTGETGTGKEMVARAIHFHSPQREMPLVKVNCAAIPENLLESELFGHVRGAFTGALSNKKGKFALADGGTIFLDEIGTLTTPLQAKLLRVLQEREFEPLGSERSQKVDVRVIAATNRDLRQMVSDGRFQEDLYYRLNVIPVHIPPLRERREDIPLLVDHFIRKHAQRAGKRIEGMEPGVLEALQSADWPGNVRELENTVERAVVLSPGAMIGPDVVRLLGVAPASSSALPSMLLRSNLDWAERETVRRALEMANGVKKDAAEAMGISQRALSYYLAKHRIE